jgi:hypothetical protein
LCGDVVHFGVVELRHLNSLPHPPAQGLLGATSGDYGCGPWHG